MSLHRYKRHLEAGDDDEMTIRFQKKTGHIRSDKRLNTNKFASHENILSSDFPTSTSRQLSDIQVDESVNNIGSRDCSGTGLTDLGDIGTAKLFQQVD